MNTLAAPGTNSVAATINDCWNAIGVHGDASCPELNAHVHCRNCPAYAAAAAALLERDLPPAFIDESTRHFSAARGAGSADTAPIIIFRIGSEWLGLPADAFSEFVDERPIHTLPHRRESVVLGLTNVRGELLVCVSLAQVLGIEQDTESRKGRQGAAYRRLAVLCDKGCRVAFPVDEVHGIHRYSSAQLGAVPATVAKATATYTRAMLSWNGTAVGCLDDQLLFYTLNRSLG